jgi:hypothetical protein
MLRLLLPVLLLLIVVFLPSAYAASQTANIHRLDSLREQVEVSVRAQQGLVEQLLLDQKTLLALGRAAGDDLQPIFVDAFKDYRDSVESAVSVSGAVAAVNQTAMRLFEAWRDEIGYLADASLKADSESEFAASWQRYQAVMKSLEKSEGMIDPVLAELRQFLIHFKYALDEASIASRGAELTNTDNNITALINALNASVVRSKDFLKVSQ